jgi:hypothetical protein
MRISSGCSRGEREKIHDRMTRSQAGERSSEMCGSDGECGGGRRGTKTGRFRRSGTNSDAILVGGGEQRTIWPRQRTLEIDYKCLFSS